MTLMTCQRFLSLYVRTHFYLYYISEQLHCLQESLDWDPRAENGLKSKWPTHHRQDSIGFARLIRIIGTIEADSSIVVNVRVEHFGDESDGGRFGGVLLCEFQFKFKKSPIPSCSFRSFNESSPMIKVAFFWGSVDTLVLFIAKFLEIADKPLLSRVAHDFNELIINNEALDFFITKERNRQLNCKKTKKNGLYHKERDLVQTVT